MDIVGTAIFGLRELLIMDALRPVSVSYSCPAEVQRRRAPIDSKNGLLGDVLRYAFAYWVLTHS